MNKLNVNQLKIFYSYQNNVCCKNIKNSTQKNTWGQSIISNVDIYTNTKNEKATHELQATPFINNNNEIDYKINLKEVN